MRDLIKINGAVVVEGKYDKITLQNVIDATIFTTDGFAIFKDREKCALLRKIAEREGIVVMTDSDSAGALIRSHLKSVCGKGKITNVYIPQLKGKERRKTVPSKQGYLGVEGMTPEIIREALLRSGVALEDKVGYTSKITKGDMFALGLSGGENASLKRDGLMSYLSLPTGISANAFLDAVNSVYGREEFFREVEKWRAQTED